MTDRDVTLRAVADEVRRREAVADAWLAKSFTDRLLVVDVHADETLPADLRRWLADRDLRGANEVYGEDAPGGGDPDDPSFAGDVGDAERHQFVDVPTRGDHRSYVCE